MAFHFLRVATFVVAAYGTTALGADPVEFVHLSDTHVIDSTGFQPRIVEQRAMYGKAVAGLTGYLASLKANPPAFVLITGDLADGFSFETPTGFREGQIELFQRIVAASPVPVYLTLGNHDVQRYRADPAADKPAGDEAAAPEARAAWRAALPRFHDGTYYSFRKQVGNTRYRFLMLDDGSAQDKAFAEAQLRWLERQIADSGSDRLIAAMHIPLDQTAYTKAIKETLRKAGNLVLVLAGHRHSDGIEEIDLGDRKVIQVRTAIFATNPANFRCLRLFEDRIEVAATGRRTSLEKTIAVPVMAGAAH